MRSARKGTNMARKERTMGKRSGAVKRGGTIEIAPMYEDISNAIHSEERAIFLLQENIFKHCKDALTALAKRRRQLWTDIYDDLGLDKKKNYALCGKTLTEASKELDAN